MPTVELFGIARLRGGQARTAVSGRTARAALEEAEHRLAGLRGVVLHEGQLVPAFRLCVNGRRFLDNLDEPLEPDDALLVISSEAGG